MIQKHKKVLRVTQTANDGMSHPKYVFPMQNTVLLYIHFNIYEVGMKMSKYNYKIDIITNESDQ